MTEARITVNGHLLTQGQTMTIRCAIEAFAAELRANNEVGDIAALYIERIKEIRRFINE